MPEWAKRKLPDLPADVRAEVEDCVARWTEENGLPQPPLEFSGSKGNTLCSRNFVGVVEAGGQAIEIYPKLDKALLWEGAEVDDQQQRSTMASLMWMLEVASHEQLFDADTSSLQTSETPFLDLWAALLGRNLYRELQSGLARAYRPVEENTTAVRGRILLQHHVLHNMNRSDRVYCGWDEFTEDRPMNQILKCVCRFLSSRVSNPDTQHVLFNCLAMLDEVSDLDVDTALRQEGRIVWDRSMQRFQLPFKLAMRLLRSIGHSSFHGGQQTYVFLLDMNQVFEDYVGAVLGQLHGVPVDAQRVIGSLFRSPNKIRQKPDFYWQKNEAEIFIADSKYKPFFSWNGDLISEEEENAAYFSPSDVRQLIVYGVMAGGNPENMNLQIIYPFVGEGELPPVDRKTTFNGMSMEAVPIRVGRREDFGELMATPGSNR
jgi:5-methylcytosine-specific restriction endonuclease McrBC regulatory subunit McrC